MRFHRSENQFVRISSCRKYAICSNASDLYTPWHLEHGQWTHIDGRGCDTAREAAQVCERHSNNEVKAA